MRVRTRSDHQVARDAQESSPEGANKPTPARQRSEKSNKWINFLRNDLLHTHSVVRREMPWSPRTTVNPVHYPWSADPSPLDDQAQSNVSPKSKLYRRPSD